MKSATSPEDCVVYHAPGDVRIERMAARPTVQAGEALIEIEACAICGTDIKSYFKGNARIQAPKINGHELCGTIVEIGADVEGYRPGQRVTMATTIGCGDCSYCRQGKTNLCRSAEAMGFHYDGAMAPFMKVPAKAVRQGHLVNVGDLDATVAALSEPLSCAVNGLSRLPLAEISRVLIIGLGPLGMLHCLALRGKGIKEIVCVEFPGMRTEMAEALGLTVVPPQEIDHVYQELSGGEGFDLVVLTAPHNASQAKAPLYAKKGGFVSYFASLPSGDEMLTVNSRTIHYNELVLYGTSDSTAGHVREAVRLLGANPDSFKTLITHVLPMRDFRLAMEEIQAGKAVKVVLVPKD